jgi:hypothetical protein
VYLAKRVHSLENARAQVVARYHGGSATVTSAFQIRGLAPGGANLAPGGAAYLSAWVGDPNPTLKQRQHFCGWVHTLDALGIPGYRVSFVAHPPGRTVKWTAGTTGVSGLVCSKRVLGGLKSGVAVNVDVYAGSLHVRTSFVPRA